MADTLWLVAACAASAVAALCALAGMLQARAGRDAARRLEEELRSTRAELDEARSVLGSLSQWAVGEAAVGKQRFDSTGREFALMSGRMDELRRETAGSLQKNRESVDARLDEVRLTVERQMGAIREDNQRQLDRMRETVDEKLTRTLNDRLSSSFRQVSDQLESVYKGLGDMRSIATGVGDLKRVLSNVKTRGMLGEVQLGAILAEILSADQYEQNVATKPGASERVEFAVKLPVEGGDPVWLPIDSKFPGDTYEHLRSAMDAGDAEAIEASRRQLEQRIKLEAKDICEKYISVPTTTNFGIMFLPFEGLYAEVVDRPGLIECLQRDYQVNVAGPSTMAAILNSLQMSYQTFAFQRRADEIQRVLAAVKAEFPKYQAELRRALKQIETAGKTVDGIINTRTNVIERKLRSVTSMDDDEEAMGLLGIDAAPLEVRGMVDEGDDRDA